MDSYVRVYVRFRPIDFSFVSTLFICFRPVDLSISVLETFLVSRVSNSSSTKRNKPRQTNRPKIHGRSAVADCFQNVNPFTYRGPRDRGYLVDHGNTRIQDPSIGRQSKPLAPLCSQRLITRSWPIRPTRAATCADMLGERFERASGVHVDDGTEKERRSRGREREKERERERESERGENRERVNSRMVGGREKERLRVG